MEILESSINISEGRGQVLEPCLNALLLADCGPAAPEAGGNES